MNDVSLQDIDVVQTYRLTIRRQSASTWAILLKADQSTLGILEAGAGPWWIEIEPSFRRRGHASETLSVMLALAQEPGEVTSQLSRATEGSAQLLDSCGFKVHPESEGLYVGPSKAEAKQRHAQRRRLAEARYLEDLARLHQHLKLPDDYALTHRLTPILEAKILQCIGQDIFDRPQHMTPLAAQAWRSLHEAAATDGVSICAVSCYRSVAYQAHIIERKLESGQTPAQILAVSAAPGYSEHHSGNAIDVTDGECEPLTEAFEASAAFEWLANHAADYGFYLSFPRDNPHRLAYEPWHWCFKSEAP